MQLSKGISDRLNEIIEPVVEEVGLELVDISARQEQKRNILVVTIDKEGGITIDDCAAVSDKISFLLDIEDVIEQKYHLEVGSPGIFRELKKERDYARSIGKRIKAVLKSPIKGKKQVIGQLTLFQDQVITITDEKGETPVRLDQVKKVQLFPEL